MTERAVQGMGPDKGRRLSRRFDCEVSAHVVSLPARKDLTGKLVNISFGGALLKVEEGLGPEILLEFDPGGGKIALGAYVIRSDDPAPKGRKPKIFGLEFHTYNGMEERLRAWLDHLAASSPK